MNFLDYVIINPTISLKKNKEYPFIEMANVNSFVREPKKIEKKVFSSGVKFADGDTVIARITPCLQNGKGFYCHDIGVGFGSTEYLVFRPKDNKVDNKYLYYLMQTSHIRNIMIKSMVGSTGRQRVNNRIFNEIEVNFPDIDIQRKIGKVLSAYDDLIENNQKQIKLLEEAAQRLYKEWFVDLRFPNYENTEILDGVPSGWRKTILQEIATFSRGKTITKKEITVGNVPVVAGGVEPAYYHNKSFTEAPVITVSGSGNAGYVRMYHQKIWASDCSYIDTSKTAYIFFTYCFLKYNQNALYNLKKGSTILHVYAKDINGLELICPPCDLLIAFENLIKPYFDKVSICINSINLAKEARDRLLPKLMSGELEV